MDYFPKDTDIFSNRKVRRLIKEFGAVGYMVHDYILCLIYSDKGYYMVFDPELPFDISDSLGNGITEEQVMGVIEGCFRIGLFNKMMHETHKIITSSGIQKRYIIAKRTGVIDLKYLVSDEETGVIAVKTPVIAAESTQSKVKESKVNKRKGNMAAIAASKSIEDREKEFGLSLREYEKQYPRTMLNDFYNHWREKNVTKTRMKFELQKTWDLGLRLARWARNDFNVKGTAESQKASSAIADLRNEQADQILNAI